MKKQRTQQELDAIKSAWYVDDESSIRWARKAGGGKKIGDLVGLCNVGGGHCMCILSIDKKNIGFVESNIIWFLRNNHWAEKEIDHIDGNPKNNSISNLRLATRSEQNMNKVSGREGRPNKGVYKREYGNKWSAQIWLNGVCKNLGTYGSEAEAIEVRQSATKLFHGSFANIKSYGIGVNTNG